MLLLVATAAMVTVRPVAVLALTQNDANAIYGDSVYYDPNSTNCDLSGSGSSIDISTLTAGAGAPDGGTFPNLNPAAMASAIDQWVATQNANSALKGLGATIVASAKNSNINPFILVAIPHEESGMADPSDFNVSHGNNAYGRSAAPGQPSFQGARAWYKWSSVKASVDYTAPENQGAKGGGDMATYLRNVFGEELDRGDIVGLMERYAPPSDGNNTAQYISNLRGWINDLIRLSGGTPTISTTSGDSGSSNTAGSCSCSASRPSTTTNVPATSLFDISSAQTIAQTSSGVDAGIAVADGSGKILAQYQGDKQFFGASITKAMLLVAYLRSVPNVPSGNIDATLKAMIENSDNASANTIYGLVGAAAVQKVATDAGMTNFVIDTSDPAYILGQSKITANDQARLFAQLDKLIPTTQLLYGKTLLSNLSKDDQWGILSSSVPAKLFSKAGWKQELPDNKWIFNQAAQVVPTNSQETILGVAVASFGSSDQNSGHQLLSNIFSKLLNPMNNSTSSGCSANCDVGGGTVTGNAAILCEAKKYDGIYYKWGGGHIPYDSFRQQCPDSAISSAPASSTSGNPGPCATDCSGLVSVAVDAAFNQKFTWTVSEGRDGGMIGSGSDNWKSIPVADAQPGDIVTLPGHVEIVDHVAGDTIYTFGSHATGTKTSGISTALNYWTSGAWRYTGPGSSQS